RKSFPKLERHLVEMRVRVEMVVGAHDRGVSTGVAAAQIALLEHGDVGETVLFREVVGARQAMPAAADDDRIVTGLGRGAAPRLRAAFVMRERVARERKDRILHGTGEAAQSKAPCRSRAGSLILAASQG